MKKLRTLVTMLVAALTLVSLSAAQADAKQRPAPTPGVATFTLNARVLDSGEQIVSVACASTRRA